MKKIRKSDLLVYMFFILITLCKGLGLSNSNKIYISIYFIGIVLVITKIFTDKLTKKEIINISILFLIGLINFFIAKETTILFCAIGLACLKNIKIRNVLMIMFWTRVFSFALMIILPILGIVNNNVMYFYRATQDSFITRYSFAYSHPNLAHSSFMIIIVLWGYLFYDKIKLRKVVLIETMNLILYCFTFSRTGLIILSLYLVLIILSKKSKVLNEKIPEVLVISLLFFIFISFVMAWGYDKFQVFNELNSLLTGRIRYMNVLVENYGIPIFGRNIYKNIIFDNGYFDLIYNGGFLATVWFVINQTKTNKTIRSNKMIKEAVVTLFLGFYSLTESYYVSLLMNPSLLFIAYSIFENNNVDIYNKSKQATK